MKQLNQSSPELIPDSASLQCFLDIESCIPEHHLIVSQMLDPLKEMISTGGKKLRFEMVEIAFKALGGLTTEKTVKQLQICEQIIEGLHLGSMIIDDIQDQSELRRGCPTFYRKYGTAVALNAGNWLYFKAIHNIQFLDLDPYQELTLQRRLNEILLKAHFGQGLDVGVNMITLPQNQVEGTYFTAAELKTGALMSLAFELGAVVARSKPSQYQVFSRLAKKFGIALQVLDDIGNFIAPPPKGKEDLKLGRPSFIWVIAARLAHPSDYELFRNATRSLPDTSLIEQWNNLFGLIPKSKKFASTYLNDLKMEFTKLLTASMPDLPHLNDEKSRTNLIFQVESIFEKLEKAYE